MNSRRITAHIQIDTPRDTVWSILTDYNNLTTHVPNLVKSYLLPHPAGKRRLFQEGAQKIVGFDFRASLTMEMDEQRDEDNSLHAHREWAIRFRLIESRMFDSFDGVWQLSSLGPERTKLLYSVYVRPRGVVPVMALEWRIKEDVPLNLYAVKLASEKRLASAKAAKSVGGLGVGRGGGLRGTSTTSTSSSNSNVPSSGSTGGYSKDTTTSSNRMAKSVSSSRPALLWDTEETLGTYINLPSSPSTAAYPAQSSGSSSSSGVEKEPRREAGRSRRGWLD